MNVNDAGQWVLSDDELKLATEADLSTDNRLQELLDGDLARQTGEQFDLGQTLMWRIGWVLQNDLIRAIEEDHQYMLDNWLDFDEGEQG